jgi:hypothetical protein
MMGILCDGGGSRRKGETNVRSWLRMPPPAPARAWEILSFWGMTGLEAATISTEGAALKVLLIDEM